MFKQFIAIILLLAFFVGTFNKAFIVLDYFSNNSSYAIKCENKAAPKLHCNGKCQMMKKLDKEEKKDEQNPERKSENKNEIYLSSKIMYNMVGVFPSTAVIILYPAQPCGKEIKMPRSIFHPPSA